MITEPPITGDNGITAPVKIAGPRSLAGWSESRSCTGVRRRRIPLWLSALPGLEASAGLPTPLPMPAEVTGRLGLRESVQVHKQMSFYVGKAVQEFSLPKACAF